MPILGFAASRGCRDRNFLVFCERRVLDDLAAHDTDFEFAWIAVILSKRLRAAL